MADKIFDVEIDTAITIKLTGRYHENSEKYAFKITHNRKTVAIGKGGLDEETLPEKVTNSPKFKRAMLALYGAVAEALD